MGVKELITASGKLINYSIGLLIGIALLTFFWGLAKYIFQSGSKDNHEEGRNIMVWGVIVLFVMVSIWGIIYFFQRSLGLVPPNDIVDPVEGKFGPPDNPLFPPDPNERNV